MKFWKIIKDAKNLVKMNLNIQFLVHILLFLHNFPIFRALWLFWGWHIGTVKIYYISTIFWIWLRTSRPPKNSLSLHHFYESNSSSKIFLALLVKWANLLLQWKLQNIYVFWINQHPTLLLSKFPSIDRFVVFLVNFKTTVVLLNLKSNP